MPRFCLLLFLTLLGGACDNPGKPLDADTRYAIDSISGVQMVRVRKQIDSLCALRRQTEMPLLVDSIRKERLREIEEKLRNLPR